MENTTSFNIFVTMFTIVYNDFEIRKLSGPVTVKTVFAGLVGECTLWACNSRNSSVLFLFFQKLM